MQGIRRGPTARSIHIMLADDNIQFLQAAALFLSADERLFVTSRATTGAEAIRLAAELRPDVLLVDSTMPDMDGVEVARRVKKLPHAPVVIVLTVFDRQTYQMTEKDRYADAFMAKVDLGSRLPPLIGNLVAG